MSQHRTWDENRSPQWKDLFQKESIQKRRTRKEIERERRTTREEQEEWTTDQSNGISHSKIRKRNTRKVSKEQLKAKIDATNNEIKKLLTKNNES